MDLQLLDQLEERVDGTITAVNELRLENALLREETAELKGHVDEYSAQYPNGEPNCCPPYFLHRVLRWDGHDEVFRATEQGQVDPDDVPPSEL